MAKATLVLHRKRQFDDGTISEMKLWLVPKTVRGSADQHYGLREETYSFTTPEQPLSDFLADVRAARRLLTTKEG